MHHFRDGKVKNLWKQSHLDLGRLLRRTFNPTSHTGTGNFSHEELKGLNATIRT